MDRYMGLQTLTSEQRRMWRRLEEKEVVETMFVHEGTLRRLGLFENVTELLFRVGIAGFLPHHAPTYERLTREFFATLNVESLPNGRVQRLSFHLNDGHYNISLKRLMRYLEWDFQIESNDVARFDRGKHYYESLFSYRLFGDDAHLATNLYHPALQMAYLAINMPILGNTDFTIHPYHLKCLWGMVTATNGNPRWDQFFINNLLLARDEDIKLGMGGVVTLIARAVGSQIPPSLPRLGQGNSFFINSRYLQIHRIISHDGDKIIWQRGSHRSEHLILPRDHVILSTDARDFSLASDFYPPPQHVLVDIPSDEDADMEEIPEGNHEAPLPEASPPTDARVAPPPLSPMRDGIQRMAETPYEPKPKVKRGRGRPRKHPLPADGAGPSGS